MDLWSINFNQIPVSGPATQSNHVLSQDHYLIRSYVKDLATMPLVSSLGFHDLEFPSFVQPFPFLMPSPRHSWRSIIPCIYLTWHCDDVGQGIEYCSRMEIEKTALCSVKCTLPIGIETHAVRGKVFILLSSPTTTTIGGVCDKPAHSIGMP